MSIAAEKFDLIRESLLGLRQAFMKAGLDVPTGIIVSEHTCKMLAFGISQECVFAGDKRTSMKIADISFMLEV